MASSSSAPHTPAQSGEGPGDTIYATPPNRGTDCTAEYQDAAIIDAIKSGILEDVRKTKECELESMFCAMLRIIAQRTDDTPENKDWAQTCLKQCLEAAIKFVNDKEDPRTISLRDGLEDYCNAVDEVGRYPGTVLALNAILCHFRTPGQRDLPAELRVSDVDELQALFRINDPAVIRPVRAKFSNSRKPDIVQLNWLTSRMLNGDAYAYDEFQDTIDAANRNTRPGTEGQTLRWDDVFSDVELKMKKRLWGRVMLDTYATHHLTARNTLPPLKPPRTGFDNDNDSLGTLSSASRIATQSGPGNIATDKTRPKPITPTRTTRQTRSYAAATSAPQISGSTSSGTGQTSSGTGQASPGTGQTSSGTGQTSSDISIANISVGSKRGSDQPISQGSNKKARKASSRLHPVVQSAIYAAERLSVGAWIKCSVGVILSDDELYLTIYDRQSPLAARGFNIIHHLPHFVVLIIILQRLQHCQWHMLAPPPPLDNDGKATSGFQIEDRIEDRIENRIKDQKATIQIKGDRFTFNPADATTYYVLNGRGTTGVAVTEVGSTQPLFLKMSWPECIRQREDKVIEKINQLSRKYPAITDHSPHLKAFERFTVHSTSRIRALLGLDPTEKGFSRVLSCGVYEMLQPITKLEGLEFWRAYWETIATHYILWQEGIEHADISISNLMYRVKDGALKGVLNDYDLARLTSDGERDGERAHDRTGTIPFMAIDLLTPEASKGKVRHLYRHDLESFAWVLFWVLSCYSEGKLHSLPEPFVDFNISAKTTYKEKSAYLSQALFNPLGSWQSINSTAPLLQGFWNEFYSARQNACILKNFRQDKSPVPEKENHKIFSDLLSFLAKDHGGPKPAEGVLTAPLSALKDLTKNGSGSVVAQLLANFPELCNIP